MTSRGEDRVPRWEGRVVSGKVPENRGEIETTPFVLGVRWRRGGTDGRVEGTRVGTKR